MKLQPSDQFKPTSTNVSGILNLYGLSCTNFISAKSGIENCTLYVQTNSGTFVLRVYRYAKKAETDIRLEAQFVEYLHAHGIPTAVPIRNLQDSPYTQFSSDNKIWYAVLMPFFTGTHADRYTDAYLRNLASTQAKMHLLAQKFPASADTKVRDVVLQEGYFIQLIENRAELDPHISSFVDRAEAYTVRIDTALPSGYCHLDYDNGNILSDNDSIVAVLDFDDMQFTAFVRCLAYTVWDIMFELGLSSIQDYVDIYEHYRPLSAEEKSLLLPLVLYRHYLIGCKDVADNAMSPELLQTYLEREQELLAAI